MFLRDMEKIVWVPLEIQVSDPERTSRIDDTSIYSLYLSGFLQYQELMRPSSFIQTSLKNLASGLDMFLLYKI